MPDHQDPNGYHQMNKGRLSDRVSLDSYLACLSHHYCYVGVFLLTRKHRCKTPSADILHDLCALHISYIGCSSASNPPGAPFLASSHESFAAFWQDTIGAISFSPSSRILHTSPAYWISLPSPAVHTVLRSKLIVMADPPVICPDLC